MQGTSLRRRMVGAVLVACVFVVGAGGSSATSRTLPRHVEIIWRADVAPSSHVRSADLEAVATILRARLARLGRTGTVTVRPTLHELVVRVFGSALGAADSRSLLAQHHLELYEFEAALLPPSKSSANEPVATTNLSRLLARAARSGGPPSGYYLFARSGTANPVRGPASTRAALLVGTHGGTPRGYDVVPVPPAAVVLTCSAATAAICPGDPNGVPPARKVDYYLLKHGLYRSDRSGPFPSLTGADVKLSATHRDFDPTSGQPIVLVRFTPSGDRIFKRVTKAQAARGSATKTNQHLAITLDAQIRSWPAIDYRQYPNGIDPAGGGMEITGFARLGEADSLVRAVQAGTLPLRFVVALRRTIP